MSKAIYAFSGDPITFGHIDIIKRAAKVFEKVIVGIGINPSKNYMFSLEEREEMAEKSLHDLQNVDVISFEGLLVDYAYEHNINVIIKGVRNTTDFDYENILHQIGESQKLGIDTFIMFAKPKLSHVSSSAVKAIQKEHGFIHDYVSLYVKQKLEAKMCSQYIIGVTGEIGAGKSYISSKLVEIGSKKNIEVHNIELDHIGHQILNELTEPKYSQIRKDIIKTFGKKVDGGNGKINRKALGEIVFNSSSELKKLNEIMYTPMLVRLKRELYGKSGIILINAALIIESDMLYITNNNVLLIKVDKKVQEERLKDRGHSKEQIERRIKSQYNFEQKYDKLTNTIKSDHQGKVWILDNSKKGNDGEISDLLDTVIRDLKII